MDNNKCWKGRRKTGTLYTTGENIEWYSLFGKQSGQSSKVKHRVAIWTNNSSPGYILKRKANLCLQSNLYRNVHISVIHNSSKVETIQMSNNPHVYQQMNGQRKCGIYLCNGVSLAIKRNEVLIYAVTWMKSVTKDHILHDFFYIKWPE